MADKGAPRRGPQNQLQETDELFAACMEETIRPCPSKSSGQHMEHEQVEEVGTFDGSDPVFSAFGMAVAEGDHAIPALQNVLLPDDAPV